jgi:hypothetical protein
MSEQSRRFSITINNPFWEPTFEEVDIEHTDLPIELDYYDLKYVGFYETLFEYHYVKANVTKNKPRLVKKVNADGVEEFVEEKYTETFDAVVKRPYFKDYAAVCKFYEKLDGCKYCCGQLEIGEETQTKHIQSFVVFKNGTRFTRVKVLFPTAHIEAANGTNTQNRDYCTKSETKVEEPFEFGTFAEMRARTDVKNFFDLLDSGATDMEIRELYPQLYLKEFKKMNELRLIRKKEIYSKQCRDIEVTYIFGSSGVGKSTYVNELVANDSVFRVDSFDKSAFTDYAGEDTLVIDEFKGQINLQFMNRLLDCFPLKVRGLGSLLPACFTKVYIISNFSYKDLYKPEQIENSGQYAGFVRRLNNIIKVEKGGVIKQLRETTFEEIPKSELKPFGRKKRIKQVVEFGEDGFRKVVYDRELQKDDFMQLELIEKTTDELPF